MPLSQNVTESIARSLQIGYNEIKLVLRDIKTYPQLPKLLEPGYYLACLAIRPCFSISRWDILVQKCARNLLPAVKLEFDELDEWGTGILHSVNGKTSEAVKNELSSRMMLLDATGEKQNKCFQALLTAIDQLNKRVGDPVFRNLRFSAQCRQGPVASRPYDSRKPSAAWMIAFYGFADIHHSHPKTALDEFLPSNLAFTYQHVYRDSVHHAEFAESVRHDFSDVGKEIAPRHSLSVASFLEGHVPELVRRKILTPAMMSKEKLPQAPTAQAAQYEGSVPVLNSDPFRSEHESDMEGKSSQQRYLDVSVSHDVEVSYENSTNAGAGGQEAFGPPSIGAQSQVDATPQQRSLVEELVHMTLASRGRYQRSIF